MRIFVLMNDDKSYLVDQYFTPNPWLLPDEIGKIVLDSLSKFENNWNSLGQIESISSPTGKTMLTEWILEKAFLHSSMSFQVLECSNVVCDGNSGNQLITISTIFHNSNPMMMAFKKEGSGMFKNCWMFDGLYPVKLQFPIMDI